MSVSNTYTNSIDLRFIFQPAHEDIYVEVFVKDKLLLSAEGKDDYYKKFNYIFQSFIDRKVDGFHTVGPNANYTLHHDGSVTGKVNI